jgi:large repetitive protein
MFCIPHNKKGNSMSFNKTIIASFVGAALTSATASAAGAQLHGSNADLTNLPIKVMAKKNKQTQHVATVSGMRNVYDANLGKATFQWAELNQAKPDMGAIAAEQQLAYAADFYLSRLTGLSAQKNNLIQPVLAGKHDIGRGAMIAKYKQEVAGIEVFNREFNIMMDREFNLVASSGYLADASSKHKISSMIKDLPSAFGESVQAVNSAFTAMGGDSNAVQLAAKASGTKYQQFAVTNLAKDKQLVGEPRAKKVFFEAKGQLVPAHYVEIETGAFDSLESEYYSYVISAKTGEVLFKNNLTSHADKFNYRVYADATGKPMDSPHGNVIPAETGTAEDSYLNAPYVAAPMVSVSNSPFSKNDAWLADDATATAGNNVKAYVDAIAPQGLTNGDYMADVTSANTFDYSYDTDSAEYTKHNRKAAIVNLFVVNNFLHDDFYDHGFDEAAGNAQNDNFGRGGEDGDAINAEVQDNSGFNNANMSTPSDGAHPRMQMYLWETTQAVNGVDFGVTVTTHPDLGLLADIQFASFGPDVYQVSGDLVRIDDATDNATDGCEAAANGDALVGKIAIIDRGSCTFVQKVLNAQAAGAIAVIIANNKDGNVPAPMGGSSDSVTIPSMGISQDEGAAIYALLDASETVSVDMFKNDLTRKFKDSSWDNGIVAHEWGHYISNRLVGNSSGLSNNQGRSMGEGWGDFHALLLLSEADDAMMAGNDMFQTAYSATSYVASFASGIRRVPYSTDLDINPLMFHHIEYSAQVHDSGEIWASMLWDSYVALINDDRHTFAEAQSLMKDYLVAGYKMTPMAPTFTEARDAVLAAAYAHDPEDYRLILAAFARRGMGVGAESPDRFSTNHLGVVQSFETELATFNVTSHDLNVNYEGLTSGYCSNDSILDKGETGTVSFSVTNTGSQALAGVTGTIEVTSGHDVTFANDGIVTLGDVAMFGSVTSAPIEFTLNEAGTGDNLTFKLTFPDLAEGTIANEYALSTTVNVDFTPRTLVGTEQYEDFNTLSRLNDFTETVMVGGDMAKGTFGLDQWDAADGLISSSAHSFASDVAYQTRVMQVGYAGDFTITWWHLYNLEADWDGAVVEVSVNGGAWADVTAMGGQFMGDGYTNTLLDYTEVEFAGQQVFSGINYGWEVVNFGETLNGNEVQFRFRQATDSAYVPPSFAGFSAGWYIDDMTFTNTTNSIFSDVIAGDANPCDNRLPYVSASADVSVNEGGSVALSVEASDPNGDALTYTWTQVSGSAATLTGADTAALSFTAPSVSATETLVFEVAVSDGTATVTDSVTVTVKDIPAPTPVKKSSGGSTGLIALLLLPLAILRRRK